VMQQRRNIDVGIVFLQKPQVCIDDTAVVEKRGVRHGGKNSLSDIRSYSVYSRTKSEQDLICGQCHPAELSDSMGKEYSTLISAAFTRGRPRSICIEKAPKKGYADRLTFGPSFLSSFVHGRAPRISTVAWRSLSNSRCLEG
jgi:hypothetical protein